MKAATKMLVVGNTIEKYHKEVGKLMEEELIKLGLLKAADVEKSKMLIYHCTKNISCTALHTFRIECT